MTIWIAILLGAVLPMVLMNTFETKTKEKEYSIEIAVLIDETVVYMDIEEYLLGVLLAEMPANFGEEALKAQAVAARTFTLYKKENGAKHQNADVCDLSACCQGYISPTKYISQGGDTMVVYKMLGAVSQTMGQALYYENALIEATYFSSSGGRTEDAQAVWGAAVPYLQSVESKEEDMSQKKNIMKDDFCTALGLPEGDVCIETPTYTKGGGIDKVFINGKLFTGMQLRKSLNLRSTKITFTVEGDGVQIVTKGYGHRVGMSQYGADAMAASGSDYEEILLHYYSGITIQPYITVEN
jgi:stage II sporulation protein D